MQLTIRNAAPTRTTQTHTRSAQHTYTTRNCCKKKFDKKKLTQNKKKYTNKINKKKE